LFDGRKNVIRLKRFINSKRKDMESREMIRKKLKNVLQTKM